VSANDVKMWDWKKLKLPEEVWLAGKGPSLKTYNWNLVGSYCFACNEAAIEISPNCFGVFVIDLPVIDNLRRWLDHRTIVFTKEKLDFPNLAIWERNDIAEITSTSVTAVQILAIMGVRKIHFVGFDSMDGDANYTPFLRDLGLRRGNTDGYKFINERLKMHLLQEQIEAVWEHRNV